MGHDRRGERSAAADAPSERVYRDLYRTAREDIKEEFQLETRFAIRAMGELGLRAGELCHIQQNWVDFDHQLIEIPGHEPCECGYCEERALSHAEEIGNRSFEEDFARRWCPKMKASVRTVPYGWNDELVHLIDRFFMEYDEYEHSRASVNRRVDRVAAASELIENTNDVYPHALRGHAARLHAREGLPAVHLRKLMGWSDIDAALTYVEMVANDVATELDRIH